MSIVVPQGKENFFTHGNGFIPADGKVIPRVGQGKTPYRPQSWAMPYLVRDRVSTKGEGHRAIQVVCARYRG